MIEYRPIEMGLPDHRHPLDLLSIDWGTNHLVTDFILLGNDNLVIRVAFDTPTIVRLLDEMPLSIEDDARDRTGLIPNHFAYRVENAVFANTQSVDWKEIMGSVEHYQFVTGCGCMDVLSNAPPKFALICADPARLAAYRQRVNDLDDDM